MTQYFFTRNYEAALTRIEDYILATTESIEFVERFLDEHDRALRFIEQNPNASATHPATGDQSWIFGDGRYRIFFKVKRDETILSFYLIHLIDNRESNEEIYPGNKIPTFEES